MRIPSAEDLPAIETLLSESGLPVEDLCEQDLSLFRIEGSPGNLDSVGGLERFGHFALLRSIATSPRLRGHGVASKMVGELEKLSGNEGIETLYLLTETAERFFESRGYSSLDRSEVPQLIRSSRQFSSLCPDSAVVMSKRIID